MLVITCPECKTSYDLILHDSVIRETMFVPCQVCDYRLRKGLNTRYYEAMPVPPDVAEAEITDPDPEAGT